MLVLIQAVLMNPFLSVCMPSILLIHWAFLSKFILWSPLIAQVLLLASWTFPGPTWWSLDSKQSTCACTAAMESLLLICPTKTPSYWSLPGCPCCRPWNLSLLSASTWTSWWTCSLPTPMPQSKDQAVPHTPPTSFPEDLSGLPQPQELVIDQYIKFHKDPSFRWGDICKTILIFWILLFSIYFSIFSIIECFDYNT